MTVFITGPSLNTLIFDNLLRFHVYKVAMIADMENAFLNIAITSIYVFYRHSLRFLWIDDIRSESPNIVTLRFARLVSGLTCSLAILNAVLHHHFTHYSTNDLPLILMIQSSLPKSLNSSEWMIMHLVPIA